MDRAARIQQITPLRPLSMWSIIKLAYYCIYSHISLFPFSRKKSQLLLEMTEQNQVKMDNITALKPAAPDAGSTAELPPNENTIEPLDLLKEPKVRTKLRIYAILVALYVHYSVFSLSE